jgi:hypothetical protein
VKKQPLRALAVARVSVVAGTSRRLCVVTQLNRIGGFAELGKDMLFHRTT